jgi:putative redox protein
MHTTPQEHPLDASNPTSWRFKLQSSLTAERTQALLVHELPDDSLHPLLYQLATRGVSVASLDIRQSSASQPVTEELLKSFSQAATSSLGAAPPLLIGHGLGGASLLSCADLLKNSAALVLIHSPASLDTWKSAAVTREAEAVRIQVGVSCVAYLSADLANRLHDEAMRAAAHDYHGAALLMYAPLNEWLSVEHATRLFTALRRSRSFIALDHPSHMLTDAAERTHLATMLTAWMQAYLPEPPPLLPLEGAKVVVQTQQSHYYTQINALGHPLVADEPTDLGGTGLGPGPYELLQAALGACTTITLRMYATRKNLDMRAVTVHLQHEKVEATPGSREKIDVFTRELSFEGDLNDEQRQRLVEIADKCPVHKTLSHAGNRIITRLK